MPSLICHHNLPFLSLNQAASFLGHLHQASKSCQSTRSEWLSSLRGRKTTFLLHGDETMLAVRTPLPKLLLVRPLRSSPRRKETLELGFVRRKQGQRAHLQPRLASPAGRAGYLSAGRLILRATVSTVAEMDAPPPSYRANVGICLVNKHNKVFVASRVDVPDSWQMPQGGIDDGEAPRHAAIRELREETGVTSAEIVGEVKEWLTYDFPPDVRAHLAKMWGQDWIGQAQKWFLFRFLGDDSEISLAGDASEEPEFLEWKWSSVDEVVARAVPFKKPVYVRAFEILTPIMLATSPPTV